MLFSGKGRLHRVPATSARLAALTGIAGAAVAIPMVTATGAQAASVGTWDKVAQCESSGNWQANTGNGHYGGLQFSSSSWQAAGGTQYAPRADQASKSQQITVAEKLLKMQGPGAWECAGAGNLGADGSSPDVNTGSGQGQQNQQSQPQSQNNVRPQDSERSDRSEQRAPAPAPAPSHKTGKGNYTVRQGDTLASIASAHNTSWKQLYQDNKSVVGHDADLILPGQKLDVG